MYIDSFIPPDCLENTHAHENIARVRSAAACAIKAGARVASLGGFSSILIEGNFDMLPERHDTVFTTGNTLTVGFVVQGIKRMCSLEGRRLHESTLLIVGATGDVGSGCARCLAPLVRRVVLHARNAERLRRLASELRTAGIAIEIATDLEEVAERADVVICAASLASPSLLLNSVAPDALICDAGYPKNLSRLRATSRCSLEDWAKLRGACGSRRIFAEFSIGILFRTWCTDAFWRGWRSLWRDDLNLSQRGGATLPPNGSRRWSRSPRATAFISLRSTTPMVR